MTSNNLDKYLTNNSNTPNITDSLNYLFTSILSLLLLFIFIIIVVLIVLILIKYRNANFLESILVQKALQKEHYDQPQVQVKGNLVVRGTTVEHKQNKMSIIVPTKFFWQLTSKIDLTHEVLTRINSSEFNEFLSSNFEEYTFSKPIYRSNHYIITGNKY